MRINLTKKDLVNSIYMQLGFSKKISENLIDDFISIILENIKKHEKLKISKFGTFSIRYKKSRIPDRTSNRQSHKDSDTKSWEQTKALTVVPKKCQPNSTWRRKETSK